MMKVKKNKLNFTSEMIMESMIGDPENATSYGNVNVGCTYTAAPGSTLQTKQKDKWKKIHKLIYIISLLGITHYLWLVKVVTVEPLIYLIIIVILLMLRVKMKFN